MTDTVRDSWGERRGAEAVTIPHEAPPNMRTWERALAHTPAYQRVESIAGMGRLFVLTLRAMFRPSFPWLGDALAETAGTIRRCVVPLVLSSATFGVGLAVVYFGGVVKLLGTVDRLGGAVEAGFTREPESWVAMMIIAGAAGSAITADLGARKIREELDALAVLGVDSVRNLVVPRVVALTLATPMLGVLGLIVGQASSYYASSVVFSNTLAPAAYRQSAFAFDYAPDIFMYIIELSVLGCFMAIVACYKGLACGSGSEGVGRAVNQSVLIMFFGLWLGHTLMNEIFFTAFPGIFVLRG